MMLGPLGDSANVELSQGRVLRDGLEERWTSAARDKDDAQTLMFGLLMADDEALRAGELASLHSTAGPDAAVRAGMWQGELRGLHSARKIALIDLCIPTLRGMGDLEYRRFVAITQQLIRGDGQVTLFEYMLQHLLRRHLASHFEKLGFPPIKYRSLGSLGRDTSVILSAMAWLGRDADEAAATWETMVANWPRGAWAPVMLPAAECGPSLIGPALERFEAATPIVKKALLELCSLAAAHDGVLSDREGELLRMVADAIGCGVPPLARSLELA
jgi:hypothetical protein